METRPRQRNAKHAGSIKFLQCGQAIVELALVVPFLLLLAIGVLAIGRVIRADMAVQAIAWDAARAGALANSRSAAMQQGLATGLSVADDYRLNRSALLLTIDASDYRRGGQVAATARYVVSLSDLPLLGWVSAPVESAHVEPVDAFRAGVPVGETP